VIALWLRSLRLPNMHAEPLKTLNSVVGFFDQNKNLLTTGFYGIEWRIRTQMLIKLIGMENASTGEVF
jgi:hypothetical protein